MCAAGANILHSRAKSEAVWTAYSGGDPRRGSKRKWAGRVLVSFTSVEPYWCATILRSVQNHFPKAALFVTNSNAPSKFPRFHELKREEPEHADDWRVVDDFEALRARGEMINARLGISLADNRRFLAKLALGVGYNVFGEAFLDTVYAKELRRFFREAAPN